MLNFFTGRQWFLDIEIDPERYEKLFQNEFSVEATASEKSHTEHNSAATLTTVLATERERRTDW